MKTFFLCIAIIAVSIVLSGCNSMKYSNSMMSNDVVIEKPNSRYVERIIIFDNCPVSGASVQESAEFAPAIAAAAAPVLVNFVYDQLKSYAIRRKDELNATRVIPSAVDLPVRTGSSKCLAVVRGMYGQQVAESTPDSSGSMTKATLQKLELTNYPDFYMEFRLIRNNVNTLMVQPAFLHYAKSAAKRVGDGVKNLTVGLAFGEKPINDEAASKTASNYLAPYSFPGVKIGTQFNENLLRHERRQLAIDAKANSSLNVSAIINESADADIATEFLITLLSDETFKKTVTKGATGVLLQVFGPNQ